MKRTLIVEFTKMHGAGNDFIVIDNRFYNFSDEELRLLAPRICARRHGIGADGVLAFAHARTKDAHFRMGYVNADGSIGTMCGNGARCLVRYARGAGISQGTLRFETLSGLCTATAPSDEMAPVRLYVAEPQDWRPHQTLAGLVPEAISGVHYLWTGTEHVVCEVEDVGATPVAAWGAAIRRDRALAPAGANVNFVQVLSDGRKQRPAALRVRTFEKGVEAETLACGTGALASALAARRLGLIHKDEAEIHMPGGTLGVGAEGGIYVEGPATTVYRGSFEM